MTGFCTFGSGVWKKEKETEKDAKKVLTNRSSFGILTKLSDSEPDAPQKTLKKVKKVVDK